LKAAVPFEVELTPSIIAHLRAQQVAVAVKPRQIVMEVSYAAASALIADRGYDSNWFSEALAKRGCESCIPSTKSRKIPLPYDKALYKQRHKIENMFAKLKDWRRIATRYDRCAHTFFSSICIAAAVAFYLNES
jgi:transposase